MPDIPIEYGNDCHIAFDPGETPFNIYARFIGMVKCPDQPPIFWSTPPNDRAFKLTQDPGIPCRWSISSGPWDVVFWMTPLPLRTTLTVQNNIDLGNYFTAQPLGIKAEGYVLHNEILSCQPWNGAHLGIGVVTWTPQATDILSAINLSKGYDLFMELRPRADGKLVYKFCRLKDATNIAILFELD